MRSRCCGGACQFKVAAGKQAYKETRPHIYNITLGLRANSIDLVFKSNVIRT